MSQLDLILDPITARSGPQRLAHLPRSARPRELVQIVLFLVMRFDLNSGKRVQKMSRSRIPVIRPPHPLPLPDVGAKSRRQPGTLEPRERGDGRWAQREDLGSEWEFLPLLFARHSRARSWIRLGNGFPCSTDRISHCFFFFRFFGLERGELIFHEYPTTIQPDTSPGICRVHSLPPAQPGIPN